MTYLASGNCLSRFLFIFHQSQNAFTEGLSFLIGTCLMVLINLLTVCIMAARNSTYDNRLDDFIT